MLEGRVRPTPAQRLAAIVTDYNDSAAFGKTGKSEFHTGVETIRLDGSPTSLAEFASILRGAGVSSRLCESMLTRADADLREFLIDAMRDPKTLAGVDINGQLSTIADSKVRQRALDIHAEITSQ